MSKNRERLAQMAHQEKGGKVHEKEKSFLFDAVAGPKDTPDLRDLVDQVRGASASGHAVLVVDGLSEVKVLELASGDRVYVRYGAGGEVLVFSQGQEVEVWTDGVPF